MNYICRDCGIVLAEDELVIEQDEHYGETVFCTCGGDVEQAKFCEVCSEFKAKDEMHEGVCDDCLEEKATADNALKYGETHKVSVEINGHLYSLFTEEQIESLLKLEMWGSYSFLPQNEKKDAKSYLFDDKDDFATWVKEEGV